MKLYQETEHNELDDLVQLRLIKKTREHAHTFIHTHKTTTTATIRTTVCYPRKNLKNVATIKNSKHLKDIRQFHFFLMYLEGKEEKYFVSAHGIQEHPPSLWSLLVAFKNTCRRR